MPRQAPRFLAPLAAALVWAGGLGLPAALSGRLAGAEFAATVLEQIPARMQRFVDEGQVAGVVSVVGSSRGVASLEAVGSLNLESATPMPKNALFRIASMTKPITALAVMILVDEGKLSVDDPVEQHLPEFKGQLLVAAREGDTLTLKPPARPVRVRDLLTHTSGLAGFPPGLANLYQSRDRTLAEATLVVSQRPLEFEPGSRWAYCNTGIDALGRIVEVLSGQAFEQFLDERIFRPLGMSDTTFYPAGEQLDRVAALYEQKEGKLVPAAAPIIGSPANARHPIPAGGLYSTAADLAQLYRAMLQGGALGETRIVSQESLQAMTQCQTGDLECGFTPGMSFGFGWAVVREPQGVHGMLSAGSYGHGGAFGTQGWLDPERDLFVVLLVQRVGLPNADASDLRRELQQLAVEALKR